MGRAAEVVVVGAGIIGASIGYELARHEAGTVVVLDKARSPGEGSTGASSSISRCRYTHSEVIRLALHGQRAYAAWSRFTGLERPRSGLNRVGVMWMMGESIEKTQRDVERLRSEGVDAEWLNPEELRDLFPVLSDCGEPFDLTGEVEHVCEPGEAFLYEPGGGYSDPVGANQDLIDAALGRGVSIEFDSPVVDLMKEGDRVAGVRLADGSAISAGLVINAAGPWCNALNEQAGFDHRWTLNPTRIQTIYRSWPDSLGALPVVRMPRRGSTSGASWAPDRFWSGRCAPRTRSRSLTIPTVSRGFRIPDSARSCWLPSTIGFLVWRPGATSPASLVYTRSIVRMCIP